MKILSGTILLMVLFLSSCQQKPVEVQQVDTEAVKVQVNDVMDRYESALTAKDLSQINPFYSEDLLYVGTDPSEFWGGRPSWIIGNRQLQIPRLPWTILLKSGKLKWLVMVTRRLLLNNYTRQKISSRIPIRFVYHLIKAEEGWLIDFVSVAFIPKNEEMSILNSALEQ